MTASAVRMLRYGKLLEVRSEQVGDPSSTLAPLYGDALAPTENVARGIAHDIDHSVISPRDIFDGNCMGVWKHHCIAMNQ